MHLFLEVIWFLLPSGVANLIPPIAAKLTPKWDTAVDLKTTVRGRRLFGSHKTIRGLISGTLMAFVTLKTQCTISTRVPAFQNLAISPVFCDVWWLGFWLGFSALAGDLLKSFLKRQLDVQPGRSWFPWDQIDWILGTLLGTYFIFKFENLFLVVAIIAGLALSFIFRVIGYWLGVNTNWI